jgi:hypothetical protein
MGWGKKMVMGGVHSRSVLYVCIYVCVYENSIMKLTKSAKKKLGEKRRLMKSNINRVNLIKVHYEHVCKITMNSLYN